MSRRTRVPGPITHDQTMGNSGERHSDRLSRWKSIDVNDGRWTLYDPNSSVVSVTTTANGLRIVNDKDETARRWNASSQTTGRYYQKLLGPDGNALTFGDFFSIEFLIKLHTLHGNASLDGSDRSGITVGICGAGVTNSQQNIKWAGQGAFLKDTDPAIFLQSVIGGDASTNNAQDGTCVGIHTTISPPVDDDDNGEDNPSTRHVAAVMLDSNNHVVHLSNGATRAAIQTHEYTVTDNVYLFLTPNWGTSINSIDDADATWGVWYRVNVARDGLNPTYIPGSGESG